MTTLPDSTTAAVEATRLPDQPCPKCGHEQVTWNYHPGGLGDYDRLNCPLRRSGGEHFHHCCGRCHYEWTTADVLSGGVS